MVVWMEVSGLRDVSVYERVMHGMICGVWREISSLIISEQFASF